jgi:V8-like Glu-specific endopeptidase
VKRALVLLALTAACGGGDEPAARLARPIVGGTTDDGDPAVVAVKLLDAQGRQVGLCTGTVISPRVVLTAGHCVEGVPGWAVYFGRKSDGGDVAFIDEIPVVEGVHHPRWDSDRLTEGYDLGLLLMARPAPEVAAPVPIRRAALAGTDAGRAVRLVGFGNTNLDIGAGIKRTATTTLGGATERVITYGDETVNSCQGDSGGPVLIDEGGEEQVAGVISFGPEGCKDYGGAVRVDVFAGELVDPYIADRDAPDCAGGGACRAGCLPKDPDCAPRPHGERCVDGAECAGGVCLPAPDDASVRYCTGLCSGAADCAPGMGCVDASGGQRVCVYPAPTPRALGAACAGDLDCASLECLALEGDDEAPARCVRYCTPDSQARGCPAGFHCAAVPGDEHACLPGDGDGGGCAVAPGRGGAGGVGVILLTLSLVGVAWTSRRSSGACASTRRSSSSARS